MKRTKQYFKKGNELFEVTLDKDQKIEEIIIKNPSGVDNSKTKCERIRNLTVTIKITPMDEYQEKGFANRLFEEQLKLIQE